MKGQIKTVQVGSCHRETWGCLLRVCEVWGASSSILLKMSSSVPLGRPSYHRFESILNTCQIIKPLPRFASLRTDMKQTQLCQVWGYFELTPVPSTCCGYVQQVLQEISFSLISVRRCEKCSSEIRRGLIWSSWLIYYEWKDNVCN